MRWILFSAFVLSISTLVNSQSDCQLARKLARNGIKSDFVQCKADPCNPDSVDVTNATDCVATAHCFVVDDKCSSKILAPTKIIREGDTADLNSLVVKEVKGNGVDQRFFNTGGGAGGAGPNFLPSCQPYPIGCNIHINNPISILEALSPPVDIPYCLRIPCDQMMPSLELDRNACVRRPGCYYDSELANMRQLVGQQVLAGVPVCQLAIRNRNFQQKIVQEKMSDGSSFNGLYSKCYLKRNPLQPNPGCPMISTLEYFGYKPKRAGWEGITDEECLFIDGCPTAQGCMLPSATSSIRVRSSTVDKPRKITPKERYGQPMCQPFEMDLSNPESFVADYNQCLRSGCVVDDSVGANEVMTALYNLIRAAPINTMQKLRVLQDVIKGDVGPDNIRETLKNLEGNSCDAMGALQNLLGGLTSNNGGGLPNLGGGNQNFGGLLNLLGGLPNLGGGSGQPNLGGLGNLLGGRPNLGGPLQDLSGLMSGGANNFLAPFSLEVGGDEDGDADDEDGSQGRFFLGGDSGNTLGPGSNLGSGLPSFPNLGGNTGPDIGTLPGMTNIPAGSQASNPFGGNTGNPLGGNLGNLFGGNTGNPFGGNTGNPLGGNLGNLFGGNTGNPFGGNTGNPLGGNLGNLFGGNTGNPFGGNTGNPFGGNTGNPFGGNTGNPFGGNTGNPFGGNTGNQGLNAILSGLGISGPGLPGTTNFGCPYAPFSLAGLPALKGRFTGCCDRNMCFYPRTTIRQQYSGIASYYGHWGVWSECSVSCGGGRQQRKRKCVTINDEECDAIEGASNTEEKICNDNSCPVLTNWAAWSECSVTCGIGMQERFRQCLPAGTKCNGDMRETRECAASSPCAVFGEWGSFSNCDSDCGPGSKERSRPCLANCDRVSSDELVESISCYTVNGEAAVAKPTSGGCIAFPACYIEVSTPCMKTDGTPGCCGEDFEERTENRRCTSGTCNFCEIPMYAKYCSNIRRGLARWTGA